MSAAVGAALKKIAIAIISDPKVLKKVLFAILVLFVALIAPMIFVASIFSGDFKVDTARLQQYVVANLSASISTAGRIRAMLQLVVCRTKCCGRF